MVWRTAPDKDKSKGTNYLQKKMRLKIICNNNKSELIFTLKIV